MSQSLISIDAGRMAAEEEELAVRDCIYDPTREQGA
jgi:hypothetical protein